MFADPVVVFVDLVDFELFCALDVLADFGLLVDFGALDEGDFVDLPFPFPVDKEGRDVDGAFVEEGTDRLTVGLEVGAVVGY